MSASEDNPSTRKIPPAILATTPVSPTLAEYGARAGTKSAGVRRASAIADKTAAVSQSSGKYQITTDADRG
ncbi:hypothetical protein L839_3851 [Mycobacterium avium MAV_120809_2495]|nr:hypothetical protein L839_3851 [Mycobacterium avium MAV_120809_2495]